MLVLGDAYRHGKKLLGSVMKGMYDGKPICCVEDAGLLTQIICDTQGDHLEIGTAYGGTAFIAIRAMDYCGRNGNKVVCIDPFGEDRRDTLHKAVEKEFWNNVERLDVKDRIEHIKEFSHPFPIENRRFGTALIDGDHSYEYVLNDWLNTKDIVEGYIMFHDYKSKRGVREVVDKHAVPNKNWELFAVHGWSVALRRC